MKESKKKLSSESHNVRDIACVKFTRDECLIIESFLDQYDIKIAPKSVAVLKRDSNAMEPIMKMNRASFGKIRYKIQHIINPKDI